MPATFPRRYAVEIHATEGGRTLVGALELASPGNKDRASKRRLFAARCAAYLARGVGLGSGNIAALSDRREATRGNTNGTVVEQADVFPIIARIIGEAHHEHQGFVKAQEIAARLLQDSEGRNLVDVAREQQEDKQSLEWLASNMVSWFSQRITVGECAWARAFERTKIDGLWAYRPLMPRETE